MLNKFKQVLIALLILGMFVSSPEANALQSQQIRSSKVIKEKFDRTINGFLYQKGLPGAVLSIYKKGELVLNESYGSVHDLAQAYPIASVSKLFTKVAINKLIDENVISPDTRAIDYLGLKYKPLDPRVYNVTVGELLDHTGGWDRDLTDDPLFNMDQLPTSINSNEALMKYVLQKYRLDHNPGEFESYSNFGYFLLGMIIEKASGQKYIDYINKEIALPNHIEVYQAKTPEENSPEYPNAKYFNLELATSSFGLAARIPDLSYLFSKTDENGSPIEQPEKNSAAWWKDGSLPSMVTSLVKHRINDVVIAVYIPGRDEDNWMSDNEKLNDLIDYTAKSVGL